MPWFPKYHNDHFGGLEVLIRFARPELNWHDWPGYAECPGHGMTETRNLRDASQPGTPSEEWGLTPIKGRPPHGAPAYSRADLKSRGWTAALIAKYLGRYDERDSVNHWANYLGWDMFWCIRVEMAERMPQFEIDFIASARRRKLTDDAISKMKANRTTKTPAGAFEKYKIEGIQSPPESKNVKFTMDNVSEESLARFIKACLEPIERARLEDGVSDTSLSGTQQQPQGHERPKAPSPPSASSDDDDEEDGGSFHAYPGRRR